MKAKEISPDTIVGQAEDMVVAAIDNEKVMMSVEKGKYYSLDPVGSGIWEILETPIRVSDLIDRLLTRYDVDRATCEKDVLLFLERLREDGIIEVHPG